jgi:hypothetical protein
VSDLSRGPGWWQASDDKWYPPELRPDFPRPPPPSPPLRPTAPPTSGTAPARTPDIPRIPAAPRQQRGEPTAAYLPESRGQQSAPSPAPAFADSPATSPIPGLLPAKPRHARHAAPKPPIYKRGWAWGIAPVVLIVIIAVAAGGSKNNPNTLATTTTSAARAPTAATATTALAQHATQSAPPTTAAIPSQQVRATLVTLGAGTFTGGKDVVAGLYNVKPGAGQSGNFIVTGSDSYNEVLGTNGGIGVVPMVRVKISNGDKIQISGLRAVTFAPVSTPSITSHATTDLYAGTWTVGQDIGAGRYLATPGAGQSGTFIVSGTDSYSEILGGDASRGEMPSVTVSLSNGDVIQISGLSKVVMTAQ